MADNIVRDILNQIKSTSDFQKLVAQIKPGTHQSGLGLPRSARLPIFAALCTDNKQPVVFVVDRADRAVAVFDELSFWLPNSQKLLFSEPNPLFYEDASWGNATRYQRLAVLALLARYHFPGCAEPSYQTVIVTSARAIMTRTMLRRDFLRATKLISLDQPYPLETFLRSNIRMGYDISDTVVEPGMISSRGGLVDLWPPSELNPVRVEFFGNQIDTIRYFNPETQRTIENIHSILITPAREFILPEDDQREKDVTYTEFHIPVLHPLTSNIFDYLPTNSLIIADDFTILENSVADSERQAINLRQDMIKDGILDERYPSPYISWAELLESIQSFTSINMGYTEIVQTTEKSNQALANSFIPIERFAGRLKQFIEYLIVLLGEGKSVVLVSRQAERLKELWENESKLSGNGNVIFIEQALSAGWSFANWYLITDSEIFGWERPRPRGRLHPLAETPEMIYADLAPGEWVVHVDYGIGKFGGVINRSIDGFERDYLCVDYANGDQVFVPVHQADRLTRYLGPGGRPPLFSHLGGREWSETKRRVQEAVQYVAEDLLDLYASRQLSTGYPFKPDTSWQSELESSFPYIETPDQIKALNEIKADMESPRPMDRLLCGDVGYGKTEVALRVAFKAVMDGKQVAILVPTTVLAQQHYETFRQRLATYPVNVEMLSRFRTLSEQDKVISNLAVGVVDIVIGTHRLISGDVTFKDLGLIIIDEEQRFGVTHKEYLKRLRVEVDVLTLTATPIPRTLYMALAGVRDISNLNTPPDERLPIITHIGPYSPRLVRQAIDRELERGGQVFFVHNRIQTIYAMRMHLEKLVPGTRIAIAHGQMPEAELASVMHQFTNGKIDILLSTSIIESGLDIPNANTLIVDRGDTFGLAQLYQLRGRVGRGATRAYAYFFRHRKLSPTPEGQERLEVIAENTQLGAGYSIAMRDLEMRGAGELLGTRQSGHIASVGFHLYTRLLAIAVKNLRISRGIRENIDNGLVSSNNIGLPVNVDLPLAIGLPESYIPNITLRLRLYRRIADLSDNASMEALREEFIDRFGAIPEIVNNLFFQIKVKMLAESAGLISVGMEMGQIVLRFPSAGLDQSSHRLPDFDVSVRGGKNAYWCKISEGEDWQEKLLDILEKINLRKVQNK